MKNEALIEGVTVAGQPTDEELQDLAAHGIKTLVNVRPAEELDEPEAPKVPSSVRYVEIPFTGATLDRKHIEQVRAALESSDGPVVVHCAGGTRAAVAVAVVESERAGEGAAGAFRRLIEADFDVYGTPYAQFIDSYFA